MSSPTKRFDLCAGRPYTTRDGEEKKQWINCGRGTQWDDGSISIELHATPTGNWFDGRMFLFEQKPKEDGRQQRQESTQRSSGGSVADPDDSIPFAPPITRRNFAALS